MMHIEGTYFRLTYRDLFHRPLFCYKLNFELLFNTSQLNYPLNNHFSIKPFIFGVFSFINIANR